MVYSHRPYRPACLTRRAMTTPTSRPVSRDPWQTRGGEEAGGWNGDRRGLSEKTRKRLTTATERRVRAEILVRRVAHFTRGVMFGSGEFVDGWFEANRSAVKGRSQLERKRGSRSLGRPATLQNFWLACHGCLVHSIGWDW